MELLKGPEAPGTLALGDNEIYQCYFGMKESTVRIRNYIGSFMVIPDITNIVCYQHFNGGSILESQRVIIFRDSVLNPR